MAINKLQDTTITNEGEVKTLQEAIKSRNNPLLNKLKPIVASKMEFDDDGSSLNKTWQVT